MYTTSGMEQSTGSCSRVLSVDDGPVLDPDLGSDRHCIRNGWRGWCLFPLPATEFWRKSLVVEGKREETDGYKTREARKGHVFPGMI